MQSFRKKRGSHRAVRRRKARTARYRRGGGPSKFPVQNDKDKLIMKVHAITILLTRTLDPKCMTRYVHFTNQLKNRPNSPAKEFAGIIRFACFLLNNPDGQLLCNGLVDASSTDILTDASLTAFLDEFGDVDLWDMTEGEIVGGGKSIFENKTLKLISTCMSLLTLLYFVWSTLSAVHSEYKNKSSHIAKTIELHNLPSVELYSIAAELMPSLQKLGYNLVITAASGAPLDEEINRLLRQKAYDFSEVTFVTKQYSIADLKKYAPEFNNTAHGQNVDKMIGTTLHYVLPDLVQKNQSFTNIIRNTNFLYDIMDGQSVATSVDFIDKFTKTITTLENFKDKLTLTNIQDTVDGTTKAILTTIDNFIDIMQVGGIDVKNMLKLQASALAAGQESTLNAQRFKDALERLETYKELSESYIIKLRNTYTNLDKEYLEAKAEVRKTFLEMIRNLILGLNDIIAAIVRVIATWGVITTGIHFVAPRGEHTAITNNSQRNVPKLSEIAGEVMKQKHIVPKLENVSVKKHASENPTIPLTGIPPKQISLSALRKMTNPQLSNVYGHILSYDRKYAKKEDYITALMQQPGYLAL